MALFATIYALKWGAYSRWSFCPKSGNVTWENKETTTIGKAHPTLVMNIFLLTHKDIRDDQEMHLGSRASLFGSNLRRLGQSHSISVSS